MLAVGSIVRAKRDSKRCRAMIATIGSNSALGDQEDESNTLCILWEPYYPKLISKRFLVTPSSINRETELEEAFVKIESAESLLPFETNPRNCMDATEAAASGSDKILGKVKVWKERGDQLLRLGDASTATSYYEKALSESSSVLIGGTVIVSSEGFPRIAEVDCIDDDDCGAIDVTLVHNNDEMTVKQSAVLLSILEVDAEKLQERILLNLARCMLQLSGLDASNRSKYLKSAVLATTLALTVSMHQEDTDGESSFLPTNSQTALTLRCKAYTGLSKWSHAKLDAQKLIKSGSNEVQAQKLLVGIERKRKLRAKTDKKLAKEICLLVQNATAASESKAKDVPSASSRISVSPLSRNTVRKRRCASSSSDIGDNKGNTNSGDFSGKIVTSFQHQKASTNMRPYSVPFVPIGLLSAFACVTLVAAGLFLSAKGSSF